MCACPQVLKSVEARAEGLASSLSAAEARAEGLLVERANGTKVSNVLYTVSLQQRKGSLQATSPVWTIQDSSANDACRCSL